MQCSVPFVQQSLCLQRWDNGLQRWVYNGFTVRFVYRIFEYSFVLGIFDSLGFRTFVLALVDSEWKKCIIPWFNCNCLLSVSLISNTELALSEAPYKNWMVAVPCWICHCCTRHQTCAMVGHGTFQSANNYISWPSVYHGYKDFWFFVSGLEQG